MGLYSHHLDTSWTPEEDETVARHTRATSLETRTVRLRLPVQKKPHYTALAPKIALGYRRNQSAGTWVVRVADGHGGHWTKGFAVADDHEDADGEHVLDFWQAQDKARSLARGSVADGRPCTVVEALDAYAANLAKRGGLPGNVSRVRHHLPPALAAKAVALLGSRELEHWRDHLDMKPATVNRTTRQLKAALNLAAKHDPRITNINAWKVGLASLRDAHRARNAILTDEEVRALIAAAYADDPAFGMLTEVAATTGARVSQLVRLEVGDLQADRADPRVMMPSSRKGHAGKRIERKPVPIPASLAARLRSSREASEPLLLRADGRPWSATSADHRLPFMRAAERIGLKPSITFYALRHTSITRQILAGAPLRVIADAHDTSTRQIEISYSAHISGHSDTLLRKGMFDAAQPVASNVRPLHGRE
jgi:integrase